MLRLRSVSTGTPEQLDTVQEVLDIQDISLTEESQENILLSADESTVEEAHHARLDQDGRKIEVEDVDSDMWKKHKKHVFIFSKSGKPIYSRHGREEQLVTKFGVMQALVSFLEDSDDMLKAFIAGEHKFVFVTRGPINFLIVSSTNQSERQLINQVSYAYYQILSVLTLHQLTETYRKKPNYDLRLLLEGTEKFIDNVLVMTDTDPSLLLGGIRCLPMSSSLRQSINGLLLQHRKKEVLFAVMLAKNHLITYMKPKEYSLQVVDIHLIFNLISASSTFRTGESWMPICLPKFNSTGFLNAYVSYISETSDVCLLLLSTSKEDFFALQEFKRKVLEKMESAGWVKELNKAVRDLSYSVPNLDTHNKGMSSVWHFMYRMKKTNLITSPRIPPIYSTPEGQERLFDLYMYMNQSMVQGTSQVKVFYHTGATESVIGWRTTAFDLYMIFHPLLSKDKAITLGNNLYKWVKHEEERLLLPSFVIY
jgi:hypothetical protein